MAAAHTDIRAIYCRETFLSAGDDGQKVFFPNISAKEHMNYMKDTECHAELKRSRDKI